MDPLICRIKEYIQPFERRLALEELRALSGGTIVPVDGDDATASTFSAFHVNDAAMLRGSLAYWRSIGDATDGLTTQLRAEATLEISRNGAAGSVTELAENVRQMVPLKLPNKRCLRYATHGLHEYRGKFFPQLVCALMNIARLPEDAVVLDPMCGSGTTLVEARLSGRRCYGLDMNPLSVFVTDVKCEALSLNPEALTAAYSKLQKILDTPASPANRRRNFISMDSDDQAYLERWFALRALKELDRIEAAIRRLSTKRLQNFFRVCMSNILRRISCQKNDDLRVRRQETEIATGETVARFLEEAARSTRAVAAFLAERGRTGRAAIGFMKLMRAWQSRYCPSSSVK